MKLSDREDLPAMTHQDQWSLLIEEPKAISEEIPPLAPLPRDLKRILLPNRHQLELWARELDALLPAGHRAGLVCPM